MVVVMMGAYWALRPKENDPKQVLGAHLLVHVLVTAVGSALVGLSIRLVRERKRPPNAR